jgi:prophage DNA circulation protein
MKDMTNMTEVNTRGELLNRIMDAAAYMREHLEMIQRAVNSCLERTLKTVAEMFNSYKDASHKMQKQINLVNTLVYFFLRAH